MSYKVNRALGYQKWGVTNPWVFANYAQPQRRRGYVSPMVFQTREPFLMSAHLGAVAEIDDLAVVRADMLRHASEELKRAERMEKIAVTGLILSGMSLMLLWNRTRK